MYKEEIYDFNRESDSFSSISLNLSVDTRRDRVTDSLVSLIEAEKLVQRLICCTYYIDGEDK